MNWSSRNTSGRSATSTLTTSPSSQTHYWNITGIYDLSCRPSRMWESSSHLSNPVYMQMKSNSSATSSHHMELKWVLPRSRKFLTGQHCRIQLKSESSMALSITLLSLFRPSLNVASYCLASSRRAQSSDGPQRNRKPLTISNACLGILRSAAPSTIPIYIVTDVSNDAIGGYYSQGKDYSTMPPASFYSRALNPAECNYPTHDQ